MKTQNANFGHKLAELRKAKGFTQLELAASIDVSQRMLVYYERHAKRPPLEKLKSIAKVLGVSFEQLLDIEPVKKMPGAPKDAYLHRKLQRVTDLPKGDQKLIVNMIDALTAKKGIQ